MTAMDRLRKQAAVNNELLQTLQRTIALAMRAKKGIDMATPNDRLTLLPAPIHLTHQKRNRDRFGVISGVRKHSAPVDRSK